MTSPWIRRTALAVGGLGVLLVIVAGVLIATFDANRYKALAVDAMQSRYQRLLRIDGPLELSFFPRLSVKLSRVHLSEHASADEFLALDEVALAVRVLPLLRGRLVVERVAARGLRVAYLRGADGHANVDDLMAAGPAAPADGGRAAASASASAPSASAALGFDIRAVQFDDLRVRLRDERSGVAGELLLQSLSTGRLAADAESPIALRASAQLSKPVAVTLALESQAMLTITPGGADGKAPTRLLLKGLQLTLSGREGAMPFSLALQVPEWTLNAPQPGSTALQVDFKLGSKPALAGTLKTAVQAQADTRGARFEPLDLRATLTDATAQPLPLQLQAQGNAAAAPGSARWALKGTLDGQGFATQGQADLSAAVPSINASAQFDTLDINRWLPSAAAAAAVPPASRVPAPAETPLSLSALKAIDGELRLQAGSLALRQFRFTELRAEARLHHGELLLPQLAARAWGGRITGSARADDQGRHLALKLDAEGVDVNALLRDVAARDVIEGTGQVTADLSSSGLTVGALRSRMAGSAALRLRDGAVKGFNVARALREAKAALSLRKDAPTRASGAEKTDFSELSLSARIADGVAQSDDLDLKSPFLRVGGAGQVDLGRGRIDYTARATIANTATGQDGEGLQALRGLTVPVRLAGPYEALDWKIVWSEVAAGALKSQLRDELAKVLGGKAAPAAAGEGGSSAPAARQRPEDLLKERLKGLLRK